MDLVAKSFEIYVFRTFGIEVDMDEFIRTINQPGFSISQLDLLDLEVHNYWIVWKDAHKLAQATHGLSPGTSTAGSPTTDPNYDYDRAMKGI